MYMFLKCTHVLMRITITYKYGWFFFFAARGKYQASLSVWRKHL